MTMTDQTHPVLAAADVALWQPDQLAGFLQALSPADLEAVTKAAADLDAACSQERVNRWMDHEIMSRRSPALAEALTRPEPVAETVVDQPEPDVDRDPDQRSGETTVDTPADTAADTPATAATVVDAVVDGTSGIDWTDTSMPAGPAAVMPSRTRYVVHEHDGADSAVVVRHDYTSAVPSVYAIDPAETGLMPAVGELEPSDPVGEPSPCPVDHRHHESVTVTGQGEHTRTELADSTAPMPAEYSAHLADQAGQLVQQAPAGAGITIVDGTVTRDPGWKPSPVPRQPGA